MGGIRHIHSYIKNKTLNTPTGFALFYNLLNFRFRQNNIDSFLRWLNSRFLQKKFRSLQFYFLRNVLSISCQIILLLIILCNL